MDTKVKDERQVNIEDSGKNGFVFALLCILLFYPPFFRGLFFDQELLPTHIFSFGLGTVWLFTKIRSKGRIIRSIPDLLGLAIVGMYFISIIYGVNVRLAIGEFLKYANYYMIYLLVRDYTVDDEKNKKTILNVLLLSGVVVSIIGIGSAIGTFSYAGAFVKGRINSTFQYPNALASYLFALFIVALGLLQNSENGKEKFFYASLANLFIFTFIPTFSRGMWLLAPMLAIVYLILVPKNKKIETIVYGFVITIPAIAFSLLFIKEIESSNAVILWGLLLVSILMTVGITYLCEKRIENLRKISYKPVVAVGVIFIIMISIIGFIALNSTQPLILSNMENKEDRYKSVSRDITDIIKNKEYKLEVNTTVKNLQSKAYAGRIDIYSVNNEGEVKRLIKENIVESNHLALNFKTIDTTETIRIEFLNYYVNTEVIFDQATLYDHQTGKKIKAIKLKYKYIPESVVSRVESITSNNTMQTRVIFYRDAYKIIKDYPIFGAGGGAWETLYSIYQSYMYWSTQAHSYIIQLWIEIGTLGFLVYLSLIGNLLVDVCKTIKHTDDMKTNMTQCTICIAWLTLIIHSVMDFDLSLGAMSILLWTLFGLTNQMQIKRGKKESKNNSLRCITIIICLILVIESWSLHRGQQYAKKAIEYAQNNSIQNAIIYLEKATKYDPFTGSYHMDLSTMYIVGGGKENQYMERAIKEIQKSVELAPYNSKILKKVGQIYMQTGDFDKGLSYIDKSVEVQPMNTNNYLDQTQRYLAVSKYLLNKDDQRGVDRIIGRIPNIKYLLNKNSKATLKTFKYNEDLNGNIQKLDYLLEYKDDMEKLKKINQVVMYNKFDMDVDKNKVVDGTHINNATQGNLQVRKENEYISIINKGEGYGTFMIDSLELQGGKKYKLEMEYSSNLKNGDIYIYDLSNGSKVIGCLENIRPSKGFMKAEIEIIVPKGAVEGKQRMDIVLRGKDNEVLKIKNIKILQEGLI
ncbi:O-antigen ligase family protein [Lutibacter sp. B2]|nr:O-antigen ligase family protein [Lutibacter sp. B2]